MTVEMECVPGASPLPEGTEILGKANPKYKHLTSEDAEHFLQHGWLRVEGSMDPQLTDQWVNDLWTRIGYDPNDPKTWHSEYLHLPRHREIPAAEFCPEAWAKAVELCGGDEMVHPYRERFYGDAFIVNFGSEGTEKIGKDDPRSRDGWHVDDDWYRCFLDSGGNAMTVILCFSDIPERGGGTWVCEDGLQGCVKYLRDHPEGLDPPFDQAGTLTKDVWDRSRFKQVVAKKGDVFLLHGLLPHKAGANFLRYARIVANPHVALAHPHNLNRADGNYTLLEQVILKGLGASSVPDFQPSRERKYWYPRNAGFKRAYADAELKRMVEAAKRKGLAPESVDSIYQRENTDEWKQYEARNGFDLPTNPNGNLMEQHGIPKFK